MTIPGNLAVVSSEMDSRGPQEAGAPTSQIIMESLEKSTAECDAWNGGNSMAKSNNRYLFFTVEYIEDNPARDYSKMFLPYEQVPFSPRATSPTLDFEHRVSPLDPNMSSTARYSPTPVQLPSVPYPSPVMVLQGPSSPPPLIISNDSNPRTHVSYTAVEDPNVANVPPTDTATDFVTTVPEEGLVTSVGGELILMQGANSEMGASTAPLMLTSIPGADFALGRDFLVIHDDQLGIINPLQNQNTEIIQEQIEQVSSVQLDEPVKSPKIIIESVIGGADMLSSDDQLPTIKLEKVELRRSKRTPNSERNWSKNYETRSKSAESIYHNVQTIADQPVPSRAIATLPEAYLTINKLSSEAEYGVFAKRTIRTRTQFGPVEGILCPYDDQPFDTGLPLLFEAADGALLRIDVSDENTSNWMRFVRPAQCHAEKNLIICQQKDGIVFLTTRSIAPNEELKAGPSVEYARRRSLAVMTANKTRWSCFECDEHFATPNELQDHLSVHDAKQKRRNLASTDNKLVKVIDGSHYPCPHCVQVFPRSYSLKRHMLTHPGAKIPRYECSTCGESFVRPYNRSLHLKIFHSDGAREKENARQNATEWMCTTCSMAFNRTTLLSIHSQIHGEGDPNDVQTVCPQCGVEFQTQNDLVSHVSKHGRLAIPKSTIVAAHKCTMCYKRFATKVRLQQHYLVHGADDQKPLSCNVCLKRFMNNSALSCHLKIHREDKRIFECPMCCQVFKQVPMLKDHIETHKGADGGFSCPHCSRMFMKYSLIRKHIRGHHAERKHKCQFCVKRFPTADKLRMHLLRHSDHREFHCANCGKQFKRKDKLKEHMTRMHNAQRVEREQQIAEANQAKKFVPKVNPTDYNRFVYKCHECLVGFKRRGMLVNHLAKRHPEVAPDSVPELKLPILRQTRDYYCQYCDKVYKSSSKRKAHIVKNHPGAALPPSNRQKETDSGLPNPTFSQTVGSVTTTPQRCQWCHKQYASKAKLLQHQRKKHPTLMKPADKVPRPRAHRSAQKRTPTLCDNNFNMSDYVESCQIDDDDDDDMADPAVIKISDDANLSNHNVELVDQPFVRIRDIR